MKHYLHHLLLAFSLLLPVHCSKKSKTQDTGFTSATAKIEKSGTNPSQSTTTSLSTLSAISSSPAPLPLATDTQMSLSIEELSLIEATYGNAPPETIPVLQATLHCQANGIHYLYDPINGCVQSFTSQEAAACDSNQWSNALGCVPADTTLQQACLNKNFYWIDNTCNPASGLSQFQCVSTNGTNLAWYDNRCFDNPNQINCLQTNKYWFSTDGDGTCLALTDLSAPLCLSYSPVLVWQATGCVLNTTNSQGVNLGSITPPQTPPTALVGIKSPQCFSGETNVNGTCMGITTGNTPAALCTTPTQTPTLLAQIYAGKYFSLSNGCPIGSTNGCANFPSVPLSLDYLESWAFSCDSGSTKGTSITNASWPPTITGKGTYKNVSFQVSVPAPTSTQTTITCSSNTSPAINGVNAGSQPATATTANPYNLSETAWMYKPTLYCSSRSSTFACANSSDYVIGFDSTGKLVCAGNTAASGPPCYTTFGTRNTSNGACTYSSSALEPLSHANVQLAGTPAFAGVADSTAATPITCLTGGIASLSVTTSTVPGYASGLSMTCATGSYPNFGQTSATPSSLSCTTGTDGFSGLIVYSNATQVVGYTVKCTDGGPSPTSSFTQDSSITATSLTCPIWSPTGSPTYATSLIPIGLTVKATANYVTQVGLLCGAWVVK
jgi:hypothetical protein